MLTFAYMPIVAKMIHYDKKRSFMWDSYIDVLVQSCIFSFNTGKDDVDQVSSHRMSNH